MKIALIGYGKMGKAIEKLILAENKHEIVLKITTSNLEDFTIENLKRADVAIEFTEPSAAYDNILKCFEADVPVVIGTTAWMDKLDDIKKRCAESGKTCMVSSNYSIGVNLFFQLNKYLAGLMKNFEDYQISMREIHHTEKKDAPSGTAVSLAQDVLGILSLKEWQLTADSGNQNRNILPIEALREPGVPGTHEIKYSSPVDEIEIKHTAKSRDGFALGAIKAAEFIAGKEGMFTMQDLFQL